MIRNGGAVEAHVWSAQTKSWTNVGTVVDAVGSSRKQLFEGREYDFVFDVDIQEGAPPLKLPYNAVENPFEAARKFLERNELSMTYLDTVGHFIVTNAKGVELGAGEDRGGPDPWGTENRYRPGETSSPAPRPPPNKPKYIPHKEYLSISGAKMDAIQNKINEINQELLSKGEKENSLNPEEVSTLGKLTEFLQTASLLKGKPSKTSSTVVDAGLDLLVKIITTWSPQNRLPGLDLLRLVAAASPQAATYQTSGCKIGEILEISGGFKDDLVNNSMLSIRTYVNLFQTNEGRVYINTEFERVCPSKKYTHPGYTFSNLMSCQRPLTWQKRPPPKRPTAT